MLIAVALRAASASAQLENGSRYSAAALADRVDRVPGQPNVSFAQFAGFVNISADHVRREMFYWFFESQRSPENDPVLLWTNGGPGCSGLLGKLTEMGPFRAADNGSALDFMSYAWNREASVIFVEQPLLVGFSVSDDPADAYTTDELNAARLATFLERWLDKFPGWRGTDLYLSSESYGGHYIPMTVQAVLAQNAEQLAAGKQAIRLRGALVGNPYTDPVENSIGLMGAVWGHGLLPTSAYEEWKQRCPPESATHMAGPSSYGTYSYDADGSSPPSSTVCRSSGWEYYQQFVGSDETVNPYALGWPVCGEFERSGGYMQRFRLFSLLQQFAGEAVVGNASSAPMRGLYSPCGEAFMGTYLNRADVRAALHVGHGRRWEMCDDSIFAGYSPTSHAAPMQPVWERIVRGTDWGALQMEPLKVLIFSGDNDAVCGVLGTQRWVSELGLNRTEFWRPWRDRKSVV